jgi:hypothetical protein
MALLQVNPPCPVYFAGWETTTVALGRSGWKISLEDDIYREEKRLLLYHPASNLKMLAISKEYYRYMERDRFNDFRDKYEQRWNGPDFTVIQAASDIMFRVSDPGLMPTFNAWADTRPTMMEFSMHEMRLSELPLFTALEKPPAKELIVEPQEVATLLEQIIRLQSPAQASIRAKQRQERVPTMHATILSFGEAA